MVRKVLERRDWVETRFPSLAWLTALRLLKAYKSLEKDRPLTCHQLCCILLSVLPYFSIKASLLSLPFLHQHSTFINMVQNKSVIFLKRPEGFPVPGEHFAVQSSEFNPVLKEGEMATRNLDLSLDPCMFSLSKIETQGVNFSHATCIRDKLCSLTQLFVHILRSLSFIDMRGRMNDSKSYIPLLRSASPCRAPVLPR